MARDEKHILIHNILIGNALEQSTNGIDEKRSGRDEKLNQTNWRIGIELINFAFVAMRKGNDTNS